MEFVVFSSDTRGIGDSGHILLVPLWYNSGERLVSFSVAADFCFSKSVAVKQQFILCVQTMSAAFLYFCLAVLRMSPL